MKRLILIIIVCASMFIGVTVSADGDHTCPHQYTISPQSYEIYSIGHLPVWNCIYCGHTDFGTLGSHLYGWPIIERFGTTDKCYKETIPCSVCAYPIQVTEVNDHVMDWYCDNFGDPQKHDKYYGCVRAVQCGYTTMGPILENHSWNANMVCIGCGYVQ